MVKTAEAEDVLAGLPARLFATDCFPCERVNMYLKIDYLLWVRVTEDLMALVEGDKEMSWSRRLKLFLIILADC
ncbi:hypothetical protein Bca52824_011537 [Brassica carinata]|uniref:Uncharacterized protein n=1 Tax=Brassica carinata TaxID=52824 RepID=A0A8X8B8K4_BRACI|nr:hypothetical protein Bca52824_011537 [Brassica carinata]